MNEVATFFASSPIFLNSFITQIIHRVNSISSANPLLFKTKGDNNNDIDAWDVQDVGVKGVYINAIPYLGSIAAFIKTPLGFVLVIGIPALLFIIFQLLNIKKAISEEVDRKVSQKLKESEFQKSKNKKEQVQLVREVSKTLFLQVEELFSVQDREVILSN